MTEWISAWDSVLMLSKQSGDVVLAKEKLLAALQLGRLRALADLYLQEAAIGDVTLQPDLRSEAIHFKTHPGSLDSEFAVFQTELPPDFFAKDWNFVEEKSSWQLGNFYAVRATKFPVPGNIIDAIHMTRRFVWGLQFMLEEISLLAAPATNPAAELALSPAHIVRKGGAPKSEYWTEFWHVIIKLALDDELNYRKFRTQADLRKRIHEEMGDRFSDETIKPVVRVLFNKFIETPNI